MVASKVWPIDRFKDPDKCPWANKIVYRTKKRAQKYADRFKNLYDKKQYVYKCGKCGYWHLTSTPQDNFK